MKPRRCGKFWTKAEDTRLLRELHQGVLVAMIAARHERTVTDVEGRIAELVGNEPGVLSGNRHIFLSVAEH